MIHKQLEEDIIRLIGYGYPDVFVVDIQLSRGRKSVFSVKVDTDEGINMAECAKISRMLGRWLEENETFPFSYLLEVSSPGIGAPLKLHRQYQKNIGRELMVTLQDNSQQEGQLVSVEESFIELKPIEKKGKKKKRKSPDQEAVQMESRIPFTEIKESKVIASI